MAAPTTTLGFIPGQNLDDRLFSQTDIAAAELLLQQYLSDAFPSLNLSKASSLYDINIRPRAIAYLLSRAEWESFQATRSLKGVVEHPELASAAIVDAILSNNLLTRRLGSKAAGRLRVTVGLDGIYVLPKTSNLTTDTGLVFHPQQDYRISTTPSAESDLRLYVQPGGTHYFLLPVVADQNGVAHQLADGVQFKIGSLVPSLILAAAYGNFQGGLDDETNGALIARIPEGQSVKNQVSRLSIAATLKEKFPEILDLSVQGMNDPAMIRNSHNLVGMKVGGYADIYVRTGTTFSVGSVKKSATLIDIDGDNNATYRVSLDRDDYPGNYSVRGILPDDGDALGSYLILSETKGFENRVNADDQPIGLVRPNRLVTAAEAAYSRFQTSNILFRVDYDAALGTRPVDQFSINLGVTVELAWMPLIKEIQQFVSDRSRGVCLADYLVRAAIPCFVQLSTVTVEADLGTSAQDVRLAVYRYINGVKMGEILRVDAIISAIKAVPGVRFVRLPIQLTGSVYAPTGSVLSIRGSSAMAIPSAPEHQVVPDNTAFIVEMSDIPIALITS